MRVGVWMPNAMPFELERSFFLDWVRYADQAGFDTLSTVDRPNYDMWDPLVSLAAAACVAAARTRFDHSPPAASAMAISGRQLSAARLWRPDGS